MSEKSQNLAVDPIVFFDGVCGLCSAFVDFLFKYDQRAIFKVATLQGKIAADELKDLPEAKNIKSIVLKDEKGIHLRSSAVLKILTRLGGVWTLTYPFFLVPTPIRDWIYEFIAKNRYEWFGKKETCRIPTAEERSRFLD